MSNLRIAGIIIGILGLLATFLIYRGPKWKRANFILFSLFNLCLIASGINPNLVNILRDMLSLQQYQYGRLLALLIVSAIFLLFYSFNTKSKLESLRIQVDKLIRSLGTADFEEKNKVEEKIRPITIVIPAYNEADNLEELLPRMPKQIEGLDVGVIVVDDGSQDNTSEIVEDYGYYSIHNKINRGQGAASRLGYDVLQKYDVQVGVTMDADNQHMPEDIERLVKPILENTYDFVIGSRVLGEQEHIIWFRNLGIKIFSWILNVATGLRITDCSSGFKAFNVSRLKLLNLTEDQFQSAEVLIEAIRKGLSVGEVPIRVNRRRHGKSKKGRDWSYGLSFAKSIVKAWWK